MGKLNLKKNTKFETYNSDGKSNGFLIPIYNNNDLVYPKGYTPSQVYLTTVKEGQIKGPHLHFKRDGMFTCIKGDVRVVIEAEKNKYDVYFSGENHDYQSIFVPRGFPAAIQNIGSDMAYVLNMPNPAWTPEMNDENDCKFLNFDFEK